MNDTNLYTLLQVSEVITETYDSCSVVFKINGHEAAFSYLPGQFLTLRIPHNNGHVARCYSIASSPLLDEPLKVTVKRVDQGIASNWICDNVKAGDEIEVLVPAGVFTPHSLDGNFLLLAGGSGITPIMSILKSALHGGSGKVALLYGNRDEKSVIFAKELNELARHYSDRLTITHWLADRDGLPSKQQMTAAFGDMQDYEAFICGPELFMDLSVEALKAAGFDRKHIHVERFISLSGDPGVATTPISKKDGEGDETTVTVLLDGEATEIEWNSSQTLLDAARAAGLDAPFSCKEGRCSACICKISDGQASMMHNEVLDDDEIAEGWLLACQAQPKSKTLSVSFDE